jgi:hypothetical protein
MVEEFSVRSKPVSLRLILILSLLIRKFPSSHPFKSFCFKFLFIITVSRRYQNHPGCDQQQSVFLLVWCDVLLLVKWFVTFRYKRAIIFISSDYNKQILLPMEHINLVTAIIKYFVKKTPFTLYSQLRSVLPNAVFSFKFPKQNPTYVFLCSVTYATCNTHYFKLDLAGSTYVTVLLLVLKATALDETGQSCDVLWRIVTGYVKFHCVNSASVCKGRLGLENSIEGIAWLLLLLCDAVSITGLFTLRLNIKIMHPVLLGNK